MYLCKDETSTFISGGQVLRLPSEFKTKGNITVTLIITATATVTIEGRNDPSGPWTSIGGTRTASAVINLQIAREMRVKFTGNTGSVTCCVWD